MFNFLRGNIISNVTIEEVDKLPPGKLLQLLLNSYKKMNISGLLEGKKVTYRVISRLESELASHNRGGKKLKSKDLEKYLEIVIPITELLKTDDPQMHYYASEFLLRIRDERVSDEMISFFSELVKPDIPICKWPYCGTVGRVLEYLKYFPDRRVIDDLLTLLGREEEWRKCVTRFASRMIYLSIKLTDEFNDLRLVKSLINCSKSRGGGYDEPAVEWLLHYFSKSSNVNGQLLSNLTYEEVHHIRWLYFKHRRWSNAMIFLDFVLNNIDILNLSDEQISKLWYEKGLAVFYKNFPREGGQEHRVTDKHEEANKYFERSIEYASEWTKGDSTKTANKSIEVLEKGKRKCKVDRSTMPPITIRYFGEFGGKKQGADFFTYKIFVDENEKRLDNIEEVEYAHPTSVPLRREIITNRDSKFALENWSWTPIFKIEVTVRYNDGWEESSIQNIDLLKGGGN